MKNLSKRIILFLILTFVAASSACSNNGADNALMRETDKILSPDTSVSISSELSGSSVHPTPSPYFLALDEIKENYKDFEILSITEVENPFVLIEWQADSTSTNRFDLYNQKTGEVDQMPTYSHYVTLKEVVSANYLIFEDSGKDSESILSTFPRTINCVRAYTDNPKSGNFIAMYENAFLGLDKSVEAGSRTEINLSAINITFDGLEVMFMPTGRDDVYFSTATTDIAPTKTSYNSSTNEFTIEIETRHIDESLICNLDLYTDINQYFSKYKITQDDNKTYIILSLRETSTEYSIQKAKAPTSNAIDGYPYFKIQFTS